MLIALAMPLCHLFFPWGTESHYSFWLLVLQPLSFRIPVLAWEGSQAPHFYFITIIAIHFPHLTPEHGKWLQGKEPCSQQVPSLYLDP